jgi:hypothetical protein
VWQGHSPVKHIEHGVSNQSLRGQHGEGQQEKLVSILAAQVLVVSLGPQRVAKQPQGRHLLTQLCLQIPLRHAKVEKGNIFEVAARAAEQILVDFPE